MDEFLQARWPGYRATLHRVLPGAFAQAVADAGTWFEYEASGQLAWRFGETHKLLLGWLPHGEGFVLPGATHFMQIQNPRGMAEALAAFWARHRFPAGGA